MIFHDLRFTIKIAALLAVLLVVSGCQALLPSSKTTNRGPWASFDAVMEAYDKIEPGNTTVADLAKLGFDPEKSPNIRSLSYLDVTSSFLINPSIRLSDLDPAVRACLESGNDCRAFQLELSAVDRQRFGTVALDIFGFRQYAREEGWTFKAMIVVNRDTVVHKVWSGSPHIARIEKKKTPLGPLQEVNLGSAVRGFTR